ncbi:Serine hydroxymethyltransferase [subsurface metagenome]
MSLASKIKELGEEIGLDIVRITNAESFPETEKHIIESVEKGYIPENDYYTFKNISKRSNNLNLNKISKRCNPKSILKRAKSIISVAQCYLIEETEDIQDKNQPLGKIAKYDTGNFYYDVKLKLKKIVDFINQETDSKYQIQVVKNAKRMADYLNKHNIRIVSGGTDTHLILIDLRSLKITGIEAENALHSVRITVNRNRIPYDPEPPTVASGIRIGTAAITSTGFIEEDIDEISDILVSVLSGAKKGFNKEEYRKRVLDLCIRHPLYLDSLELAELINRKNNFSDH